MNSEEDQQMALFRYQVIAPLLSLGGPRGDLRREIRRLADRTHDHPRRGGVRVGFGTIEEWMYRYRKEGLDGLQPQPRKDRGASRRIDGDLAVRIEELARGRPDLDGPGILAELRTPREGEQAPSLLPSLSTLYRFLRAQGLDQRRAPGRRDHRAYVFDLAGDCWQGDVMYGPSLPAKDGTRRKTYLLAILDDATRVIAHAQFYYEQHLRSLKDCLKQAFCKRGLPRRLYFDNGQIFRSRMLLLLAARLGIHLIHSRPYQPQGRAKIERWFLSIRTGFLPRVDLDRLEDLAALNRLLFAWIEGEYHVTPHRGLGGEAPLDVWLRLSQGIRPLPRDVDLDQLFLEQTSRRVAKDGTLTLNGKTYEAGPYLIGERVTVRFDPFDLRRVLVRGAHGDERDVFPVDLQGNRRVRRNPEERENENHRPHPTGTEGAHPQAPLQALERLARKLEQAARSDPEKGTSR
jgi:putative transposase